MRNLYLLPSVILIICFYSCSNESEYNGQVDTATAAATSKVITTIGEMPDEVKNIIAESKPYISPQMQEFIDMTDTITTVHPIEEIFPFLFVEETSDSTLSTRSSTLPTTILTGYSNYETILNPITVTLTSYSSSALRQSLRYADNISLLGNGPYNVKFYAFTLYAYFTSQISNIAATPVTNDFIGINPDKMPSSFNNSTSLSFGFTITPLINGLLYQFTTYAMELSVGDGVTLFFPIINQTSLSPANWGSNLEWTVLAI